MSFMTQLDTVRRFRIRRKEPHHIQPAKPRPHRRDCQGQLLAALEKLAGSSSLIGDVTMRPWCSATFLGAQHSIVLRFDGDLAAQQAEAFAEILPEAQFTLRGHIVADVGAVTVREEVDGGASISLSILTIEDW